MIDLAVRFLADELNSYFQRRTATAGDSNPMKVVAGGLLDDNGKPVPGTRLTVINIEEERVLRPPAVEYTMVNGKQVARDAPLHLSIQLLIACQGGTYETCLRYIALVLTFFQAHKSFDPVEYPGLDQRIDKLTAELMSFGPEQLNQIWAYLGAKYQPSVVYRLRMLALQDEEPRGMDVPITSIETLYQVR